ncbi:MAG: HAD-IIB family hydrolase, partial [Dialister micraerophilus]|nr:HAD-IIB family hydrolase [Dialister micraerophilus]
MKNIRLIAIDLDGTLLRDDISVSDYTKKVLSKVREKGINIVIATGRMFCSAREWGKAIGIGDVPLCAYT